MRSFVLPPARQERQKRCWGAGGGGTKTDCSTAGGGPVCEADPNFAIQDVRKGCCFHTVPHFGTLPPSSGPSSLNPTVPVELLLKVIAPVEHVAQKRKATFASSFSRCRPHISSFIEHSLIRTFRLSCIDKLDLHTKYTHELTVQMFLPIDL